MSRTERLIDAEHSQGDGLLGSKQTESFSSRSDTTTRMSGLQPELEQQLHDLLTRPSRRSGVARALGFRYDADMLPVAIVIVVFVADTYLFCTQSVLMNFCWFLVMLLPKAFISAWNHHHAHVSTFESTFSNSLLEILYLTMTGVGPGLWYLHHVLGHHRHYLDQRLDESGWRTKGGRTMGSIEYGLEVWATAYWRAICVGREHRRHLGRVLLWLLVAALVFSVLVYYRGFPVLITLGLAPTVSLYITAWHTYFHHSGLPDTTSHFEASFNIEDPLYNLLTLNLGYHTAHHYRGSIHWSLLPEVHEILRPLIPPNLLRLPPVPLRYLAQPLRKHSQSTVPAVQRVYQVPADSWHRWHHLDAIVNVPPVLRVIPDRLRPSQPIGSDGPGRACCRSKSGG